MLFPFPSVTLLRCIVLSPTLSNKNILSSSFTLPGNPEVWRRLAFINNCTINMEEITFDNPESRPVDCNRIPHYSIEKTETRPARPHPGSLLLTSVIESIPEPDLWTTPELVSQEHTHSPGYSLARTDQLTARLSSLWNDGTVVRVPVSA